jgi:hypothetical protein
MLSVQCALLNKGRGGNRILVRRPLIICPVFLLCRAKVTKADGTVKFVDMPLPGMENFLCDYSGGGTKGAIWQAKRWSGEPVALFQYGYNQVDIAFLQYTHNSLYCHIMHEQLNCRFLFLRSIEGARASAKHIFPEALEALHRGDWSFLWGSACVILDRRDVLRTAVHVAAFLRRCLSRYSRRTSSSCPRQL